MTASIHCARLAFGICVMALATGFYPFAIQAQELSSPPSLGAVPEGLIVDMLASQTLEAYNESGGVGGSLARLPLDSGEQIERAASGTLDSLFSNLLYVETGSVTILTDSGAWYLQAGEQVFLAANVSYEILNESDECASLLQVSAASFGRGIMSRPAEKVPNTPRNSCGEPSVLLNYSMPLSPSSPPMSLFVAELTWPSSGDAGVSGGSSTVHPGSVGLHVTSGMLRFEEPANDGSVTYSPITIYLDEGASIEVPSGTPYSASSGDDSGLVEFGQSATALMAGVIPSGRELFVPPNEITATATAPSSGPSSLDVPTEISSYISPNFGFSVSWDPATWTVPDEAEHSEPGLDILRLEAATGPIIVTGTNEYDGDVNACLESESASRSDPEAGISQWEVAVDANDNELTGSDETSAWGVYTNVFTDPNDPDREPVNYVDYINCVSMGDGASVVIFYSYARREDYSDHIGRVQEVVDSLQLPSG